MSLGVLDLNGNPQTSFGFAIDFASEKQWDIQVVGRTGVSLKSLDGANVFYFGRFSPSDAWTSLATGLSLSAHDGVLVTVHLKVATNETTTPKQQRTQLYFQ